ncbi:hypothetical protein CAC42_1821 [Sphaceloma murrayae]|uniref:Uncharacterized protein n=1 Tax=Sphaceloma murrayae TaxID=2082308 RepID=A0A2K1QVK3_9PEZI|nr:hypothetical protein CAC42_1821 [Sphaceloma murrayae]
MKFTLASIFLLIVSPVMGSAIVEKRSVLNGPCTVNPGDLSGVCVTTTNCANAGGDSFVGFCPGTPNNVRCCIKADCSGSRSACLWTSQGCKGGTFLTGLCPGPAGFKCCRLN